MQDLADDTTDATACYDLMRTVAEGDLVVLQIVPDPADMAHTNGMC